MTILKAVEAVAIAAAVLVGAMLGGTAAAMGAGWVLSRMARKWGTDDSKPLLPPRITQPVDSKEDADAIRDRAAARRVRADEQHHEGRAIESGEPPRSKLELASSDTWRRRA